MAASTTPVGSTPSGVWKSFSAWVSSSVHTPSIGPSQNPTSDRIVCNMTVWRACSWPTAANFSCRARAVASSTKPVTGSSLSVWSCSTAATVFGP